MKSSAFYHQISISNPGYIYDYSLSVYGQSVSIRIRSPIRGHTGGCRLSYKIQDGKVQWLQKEKTVWFARHDNMRIIQYLRNIPQRIYEQWMENPIKIPVMPIEILQQIQQMEGQQITKISDIQQSIICDKRKKELFAENQRRQIEKGQTQCIFCTIILTPPKYHQLKCGHCFHYPCIKKYCHQIKNQCPVCKYTPKRQ